MGTVCQHYLRPLEPVKNLLALARHILAARRIVLVHLAHRLLLARPQRLHVQPSDEGVSVAKGGHAGRGRRDAVGGAAVGLARGGAADKGEGGDLRDGEAAVVAGGGAGGGDVDDDEVGEGVGGEEQSFVGGEGGGDADAGGNDMLEGRGELRVGGVTVCQWL